jgi:hypothetical protein
MLGGFWNHSTKDVSALHNRVGLFGEFQSSHQSSGRELKLIQRCAKIIAPVINGLAMLAFALYYVAWKFCE